MFAYGNESAILVKTKLQFHETRLEFHMVMAG